MLTFRDMTLDDRDTVLPMVDAFYRSNAVDHPVPREIVDDVDRKMRQAQEKEND